ncbi:MAG: O-antigen polysaccharide polymerase Wzy family protein [Oscillospiraceae bacterium]|jgi:oligosaccharide repeat unit polymerase|nr:O-antigen polysaccharide polymerase Wzy family protein [Oscillospiraceae bacterium]
MTVFSAKSGIRNTILFGMVLVLMLTANFLTVFGGFFYETAADFMFAANVMLNLAVVCDLIPHIRRDFPFLVFVGTYNILLLGRVYVSFLAHYEEILYYLEAENFYSLFIALQVVTLALLCIYAGYQLMGPLFARREQKIREKGWAAVSQSPAVPIIRQISTVVLLVSSIASFYTLMLSVLNVLRSGYLGSFTQVTDSNIPSVVSRLSMFFVPSFAVFLATMPSRKQLRLPMTVYGVYLLATLFTGRRNTFVCEAITILIYFVLRDSLNEKKKRIFKRRTVVGGGVLAVVLMYLLQRLAEIRAYGLLSHRNFMDTVINFLYSQGASFRVVIQTVNSWNLFQHGTTWHYLFYPFELFIHNNLITRSMFGLSPIIEVQTTSFVADTHNYAHALTYLVDPQRYLAGGGFGTSFVAESYVAFGFIGVVAVSAGVGIFLRFFSSMLTRSWVVTASCLLALRDFVYLPRSFAFLWVTNVFNITYLCFYVAIYLAALLALRLGTHVRPVCRTRLGEESS